MLKYTVNALDAAQSQMSLFLNHKMALCAYWKSRGRVFIALLLFYVWKHTVSMLHLALVIGMDGLTTMG